MSGRSLSRSLVLLALVLLLAPAEAFADHQIFISNVPSTVQANSSFIITVTGTEQTCTSGSISMSSNMGGSIVFSPQSWVASNGTTVRNVTVFVGNVSGFLSITAAYSASGGFFSGCSGTNFTSRSTTVVNQGTSGFTPGTTNPVSAGLARSITISLSTFASQPATFNLSASGQGSVGATVPSSVTVAAGSNFTTFSVTGGSQGDLTISGTSTTSAYSSPAPVTVKVSGTMNLAPGTFCCVQSGGTSQVTVGLARSNPFGMITTNVPFTTGLTISGGAAASGTTLSTSSLNFVAGNTTQTVTLTGGPSIGDVTLSFTNPAGNPYVSTTNSFTFKVQGKAAITNVPASLEVGESASITVQLSHPSINTFTVNLTLSGNSGGASLSQTSVTFSAGQQSKTVTVTAGPNASNIPLSIGGFVPGNPVTLYFANAVTSASTIVKRTTAPTPVGTNVSVIPPEPDGGAVSVKVTFDEVSVAGQTRLTNVATPVAPPSGYEIPGTPLYFGLSTTASIAGNMTVCSNYPNGAASDETELRLFTLGPDGWVDTTISVDTVQDSICGATLGTGGATFAIFRLNSAPEVGAIAGPTGITIAGELQQFSATFTDVDVTDAHTGVWVWGDGTTSPAIITKVDGVNTATGEHAFAGGTYQVRLVISDGGQPDASDDFQVISDGAAPVINALTANPGSLWEPNSKMYDVTLTIQATDDTGVPVCEISGVSVTSKNEKQTAYAITGPMTLQLKAFPHTTYTATVTCTDAVGRTTQKSVAVSVVK